MDFEAIKKAAQGYQADMSRFLRDMISHPSESCEEKESTIIPREVIAYWTQNDWKCSSRSPTLSSLPRASSSVVWISPLMAFSTIRREEMS